MELLAPESYLQATQAERALVCNGCGPGSWRFDLIPDSILGLSIKEACNIHDWMYAWGEDRLKADIWFLANMVLLAAKGNKWIFIPRLSLICKYFLAVRIGGGAYHGSANA